MARRLLVTHHAPDLDAIGSVWLFKTFESQHYADAKVAFVNPGAQLSEEERSELQIDLKLVIHVDTGLGEFDHHQPEHGQSFISASSLVYEHLLKVHPELADDQALKTLVNFITEVDHFGEVHWPESDNSRYCFMIHELIRGVEFTDPHDDESQLYFGMECLRMAYAALTQHLKAIELVQEGNPFNIKAGKCLALETKNDDTIKVAQKQGYLLVVKKDPEQGHIRIKVRPDASLTLEKLSEAMKTRDKIGTWYFHPSGKMLINGTRKHHNQTPSPLTLQAVVELIQELYA